MTDQGKFTSSGFPDAGEAAKFFHFFHLSEIPSALTFQFFSNLLPLETTSCLPAGAIGDGQLF
jgi:hypothetical protein